MSISSPILSDEILIERVAALNQEAFTTLFERYGDNMLRYFYRMLNHDQALAEDFVQDLFLKVIEKAGTFRPGNRFSPWLYRIASNMCKNEYRRRTVRGIQESVQEDLNPSDLLSVEEEMQQHAFSKDLVIALNDLSAEHKEVFILRYQEELKVKDIGEIMQCSPGTVKSRIFYTLRKLAIRLEIYRPLDHK